MDYKEVNASRKTHQKDSSPGRKKDTSLQTAPLEESELIKQSHNNITLLAPQLSSLICELTPLALKNLIIVGNQTHALQLLAT